MTLILFIIRLYRQITFWLRSAQVPGFVYTPCKFYPSCSEYAELSVHKHGVIKGSYKSITRIIRCNPLNTGGVDYPS